jgi:hypothetical protein
MRVLWMIPCTIRYTVCPVMVPPPLAVRLSAPGGHVPAGACQGQLPPSGGRNEGISVWLLNTFMWRRIMGSAFGFPAIAASRKPCTVHEVV